jgi:hypothetical protein
LRSIRLHLTLTGRPAASAFAVLADSAFGERKAETTLDPIRHQIHFRTEDQVAVLEGSWSCVDDGPDTAVTFAARLDMGDPSCPDPHEPVAVRTLVEDTVIRLTGLFPGQMRIDDVVIQAHQPVPAA